MLTILDIIENEIVDRWGTYKGPLQIKDGDSNVYPWEHDKVNYFIYCSKYVLEGLYQSLLSRGFLLATYIYDGPEVERGVFTYKFPKVGIIQIIPKLTQGYVIVENNISDDFKIKHIEESNKCRI